MYKKLTAGAALLLGASGVAMAQAPPLLELPPLVVANVQATADVPIDSIAVGVPCVDAVQALRAVPLEFQSINAQGSLLIFVMSEAGDSGANAILICAPETPAAPPPPQ